MVERSRPWTGIAPGDSGPYSDDQWTDVWKGVAPIIAEQGVFQDQLNRLQLSGVAASPVSVASGRALVNGIWYESDAAVSHAIANATAGNVRVDRIVLRADWALQTVRQLVVQGANVAANPAPPALVQADGVTWDLPLWQVHATDVGVLTFFRDERSFIGQYGPVGVTDERVYIESEFYMPDAPLVNGDRFDKWEVTVVGAANNVQDFDAAGFGAGAASFVWIGGGVGSTVFIQNRSHRPEAINGHLIMRAKQPNTDATLDRIIGFQDGLGALAPANGVFFRANGVGQWEAATYAAGVPTLTPNVQALDDVWRKFETRQVGTSVVTFLIDDVVVATHRTNIPSATAQFLRLGILDDGVGAPAAQAYIDLDRVTLRGDR